MIFSSGWENMHEVEPLNSGTRFLPSPASSRHALSSLELTNPICDYDAIADHLESLLLATSRSENPIASAGRVKQLMMKWHGLMAARGVGDNGAQK